MNPEFQPQITQMNTDDSAAEKHLRSSVPSAAKEEHSPKISVIVPVYKVEKYLPECIESVLAQTFTDFELILVDDGSPDNSGAICDAYAARDPRIRVFHKENGGVTSARRLGVERSRGEWVMFVDADDALEQRALELLFNETLDENVDLVEGEFSEGSRIKRKSKDRNRIECEGMRYAQAVFDCVFLHGPWAKIIRRKLFYLSPRPLDIPSWIIYAEDILMDFRLGMNLRRAVKIRFPVYFYRENLSSVSHTFRISTGYLLKYKKILDICRISPHWNNLCDAYWERFCVQYFCKIYAFSDDFDARNPDVKSVIEMLLKKPNKSLSLRICLLEFQCPFLSSFHLMPKLVCFAEKIRRFIKKIRVL